MRAKNYGINIISFLSHTNHELHVLDKAYFKPFQMAFRTYRDLWNTKNIGNKCREEKLAQWALLAQK